MLQDNTQALQALAATLNIPLSSTPTAFAMW